MNFLAHSFLSFRNEDLLFGNFIGDFIKGRQWEQLPPQVGAGVVLHRAIDAFTDGHAVVSECKTIIRPWAGRYAGPVVDILFDHILAQNWEQFAAEPLDQFIAFVYDILHRRQAEAPSILQSRLPYMLAGRFLDEYRTESGMRQVFERFSRRIPLEKAGKDVLDGFYANEEVFKAGFFEFFPALTLETAVFTPEK